MRFLSMRPNADSVPENAGPTGKMGKKASARLAIRPQCPMLSSTTERSLS